MRITSIGHAGLKVTSPSGSILVDPWFSPSGAFLGSWFQYPSNEHLLDSPVLDCDAIVISHEHLDHVDPWFLARVSGEVPVYVPHYPSPALIEKVLSGGDRPIVELGEYEEREVAPGISVFFVSEESPMNHDSAIIVSIGGKTLLNMNDARLSPPQVREIERRVGGAIEVLAIQGAGASWFPICYLQDENRKRELSIRKRATKLSYIAKMYELTTPAMVLPFAGPPAFLDDDLRYANREMGDAGIFPDQQQVATWMRNEAHIHDVEVLLPGDTLDTDSSSVQRDPQWASFSFTDRERYIDEYAERRRPELENLLTQYPEPTRDLWNDFVDYFDRVLAMSPYFNDKIDMKVGFHIEGPGGGNWSVDFRVGSEGVFRDTDDCQYTYRFVLRRLPPILSGQLPWEDFFLSLRFEAWRDPDLYNDHLLGLLKFVWPEALRAVRDYEVAERDTATIDVSFEGVTYRIERFCPHAGQDLADTGEVLPGAVLRCLGHHYEFDLATGECLTGRSRPLSTEILEVDDRYQARADRGAGPVTDPSTVDTG